ncbi:MAG: hypothetical protein HY852_20105 [Bradyrhizobium sp.]|uniref:ClpXP protease specificity-enhancing factor SspB n=1 Tax=Bradyrhizobium sp. TaxID=376 RepID=UPI0025B9CDE5|nr:ClpXP protease specificity-enhancing factor SspB [Bradyrhizobium sp.]MBI5264111.1 hypothetical protein [Bradyrhizobium sp.]
MTRFFLLLALLALAFPARAEPCGAVPPRADLAATLRLAGEERPIHIQFRTRADGVKMPGYLLAQFPEEMTVILQYQFDRLTLKADRFEVGLWFKRRYARLTIPFAAITGFWDTTVRKCEGETRV